MANQIRILFASALIGLTALPAGAASDQAPTVVGSFAEQVSINTTRFILMFDAPIENLTSGDFRVTAGCSFGYLEVQDATAQVELMDCPSGFVELVLLANSVGSSVLGPSENHVVGIEIVATVPSVPIPSPSPTAPATSSPEPSPIPTPIPTPPPIANPEPVPNPEPSPVPPPIAELPTTSPEIQQSSSPSVSDSAVVSVSESAAVEWDAELVVVTVTPAANSEPEGTASNQDSLLAALQEEGEMHEEGSPKLVGVTSEEVVIEPVAGKRLEFDENRDSQWIWFVGLGSLTLLAIGLIRRFSGR
jgi:hypothetical protein